MLHVNCSLTLHVYGYIACTWSYVTCVSLQNKGDNKGKSNLLCQQQHPPNTDWAPDLCPPGALQDVDEGARHLLLVLDADDGLQHRAQHGVVVGDELCELLVLLHWQDVDGLEAGLDADRRAASLCLAGGRRADRVPLFHKLAARHARHRDVDQSHVVVLVLLLLLVHVAVDVHGDAVHGGQAGEVEVLAPEQAVVASFAGGPSVQDVVQTQLAEIFLLRRQIFGFDDPQSQQVLRPPTVVLETQTIILNTFIITIY